MRPCTRRITSAEDVIKATSLNDVLGETRSLAQNRPKRTPTAHQASRIETMTDVLIIGDTFRSPELRHEVPLGVPDPFVYLERDGVRHVYVGSMEVPRIRGIARDVVVHPLEEIGIDELYAQGLGWLEIRHEWAARAVAHAGLTQAAVPNTFPSGYLDRLRRDGVELTVDQPAFDARRRVKGGAELEGIRRAQHAAEAGL